MALSSDKSATSCLSLRFSSSSWRSRLSSETPKPPYFLRQIENVDSTIPQEAAALADRSEGFKLAQGKRNLLLGMLDSPMLDL